MTILVNKVKFDESRMWLELNDGRVLGVPLSWYPRLQKATPTELERYELSSDGGIHWDHLDENILLKGLLDGRKDPNPNWSMADYLARTNQKVPTSL